LEDLCRKAEGQHGSIPDVTLPKINSAFHSLGGISKISSRTYEHHAWVPYSSI